MDEWMNDLMNEWMIWWMDEWINEWMIAWMNECMNEWLYEYINNFTNQSNAAGWRQRDMNVANHPACVQHASIHIV